MLESEFTDFKGKTQRQFDREPADNDEDMLKKIEYPKRVQVLVDRGAFIKGLPVMDLATFKANLHKYKPLSIVNYGDLRYSSVVCEERLC